MSTQTAAPREVVVSTFTVVNDTGQALEDAVVRVVVPEGVDDFLGFAADGTCHNLRNNCYPGQVIRWSTGPLDPGARKSFQLPLSLDEKAVGWISSCGVVQAEAVSGSASCASVKVTEGR